MVSRLAFCVAWLAISTLAAAAYSDSPETVLLHPLDSAEGIVVTWASECPEKRIEANADRRFVSEGKASLHLAARSGKKAGKNYYAGVRIPLGNVDARWHPILLDCWTSTPQATEAIYVRLYGPDGQVAASWCDWNRSLKGSSPLRPRLDWGVGRGGFHWEAAMVKAPETSSIVAAEILIGTSLADARFDVYVDNLRMGRTRHEPFTKVTQAKKLCLHTALVREGKPQAVIVAPGDAALSVSALKLQAGIEKLSGVKLSIVKPEAITPDTLAAGNAILLGNVCNNRAMLPLYAQLYTPVDDFYPAADGYLVHTVHDPWGTGKNVLIVGGATPAGVARGVETLLASLKPGKDVSARREAPDPAETDGRQVARGQGRPSVASVARSGDRPQRESLKPGKEIVLPKLTLADLGKSEMERFARRRQTLTAEAIQREVQAARRDFARGAHRSVATHMGRYGVEYCCSGNDMLATLYKELALAWYESYLAKPPIYGGPWGMDMDFHLMEILPAWDLLEESPSLSEEDRLKVTRILYEFITTDVVRKASGALRSSHVRHNHMTFPALGLLFAGNYFQKGYHAAEADQWLEIARACFTLQAKSVKPYEDCNGYGWLVPYHTMRYALATLDPDYFTSGNVRRQAEYAILTMDNLGYQVPYGDTGSYQCWWTEIPFLRGAAFYERDGRCAWTLQKKLAVHPDTSLHQFQCRVTPKEPIDLLGLRAIPLEKMYWETFQGPATLPLEKTVDKIVMRASFDPGREYLLLDGLSNGGHKHDDGNSISRITDRGRIWLADNDYIRSLPKFHNSLLVFKDGQAVAIPAYCELEAAADGPQQGLSRTVVRNYNGVDWHRTIVWNKGKCFLVFDDLVAQEAADFDFHCLWHTVGEVRLTAEGLEVEQKGPRFFVKNAPGVQLKLSHDAELGRNWAGYPFAKPVVHSLRQVKSVRLAKGQRAGFANLLYASDDATPQQFAIAGGDNGRVSVTDAQGNAIFTSGGSQPAAEGAVAVALAGLRDFWKQPSPAPAAAHSAKAPATLQPGKAIWSLSSTEASQQAAKRLLTNSPRPLAGEGPAVRARGLNTASKRAAAPTPEKFIALASGDLDGDGLDETLVGSDQNHVYCLGPDGKLRWSHSARGPVTTVATAHLDRSKKRCAIAGSEDCKVYALEADGALRWSFELPQYKGRGRVRVLFAADINADGHDEVIAGGDNWRYYALDHNGQELWHYESVHQSTAGAAADLDGDGKLETLCGTAYYWWHCAGPDGDKRWSYSVKGPHATVALAANLEGGKRRAAVFGSEDGNLHVLDHAGRLQWTFNVGDQVTGARALDLDGDGRQEIVAASMSFSVFAVNAAGKCRWRANLGDPVLSLATADVNGDGRPEIVAGCQDGNVYVLDRAGKTIGRFLLPAPAAGLVAARLQADTKSRIIARTADAATAVEW